MTRYRITTEPKRGQSRVYEFDTFADALEFVGKQASLVCSLSWEVIS